MQKFETLRRPLLEFWVRTLERRENNAKFYGDLRLCQQPRAAHALCSDHQLIQHPSHLAMYNPIFHSLSLKNKTQIIQFIFVHISKICFKFPIKTSFLHTSSVDKEMHFFYSHITPARNIWTIWLISNNSSIFNNNSIYHELGVTTKLV